MIFEICSKNIMEKEDTQEGRKSTVKLKEYKKNEYRLTFKEIQGQKVNSQERKESNNRMEVSAKGEGGI